MRGNRLFKFIDFTIGIFFSFLLSLFLSRKQKRGAVANEYSRILVVKLAALGDAVLLVPALRALRRRFPQAQITFLGTSLTEAFLKQFPEYVDHSIVLNVGSILYNPSYLLSILRELRELHCEVAIDFEQWTRLVPILLTLANIPCRIGFKTAGQYRHFPFTLSCERDRNRHEVENFLRLAALAGATEDHKDLEVKVNHELPCRVQETLVAKGWDGKVPLVVMHPGCGVHGYPREWKPSRYAELAFMLSKNNQLYVVITGTEGESRTMDALRDSLSVPAAMFQIIDPERFVALLSLASLFVSGNNGAMHLAAAMRVPQVALHGPTNPKQWGPLNPNAAVIQSRCPECPCLDLGFEYHRSDGYCMEQIDPDDVFRAASSLLTKKSRGAAG